MVKIALNQHGTRALQKMIEFISTPEQVQVIFPKQFLSAADVDLDPNHHLRSQGSSGRSYPGSQRQSCYPKMLEPPFTGRRTGLLPLSLEMLI